MVGQTTPQSYHGNPRYGAVQVRHFGAYGDGVRDDTAAIQAAIDRAASVGAGVYLPPGDYLVTSSLVLRAGTVLEGAGRSSRLVQGTLGVPIATSEDPEGLVVRRLRFSGIAGDAEASGNHGIVIDGSTDTIGDGQDALIEDCVFETFRHYGAIVRYVDGVDAVLNVFDRCTHGMRFDNCRAGVMWRNRVLGSQFTTGNTVGLSVQTDGSPAASTHSQDCNIVDNQIRDHNNGQSILIHDLVRGVVVQNEITNCKIGVHVGAAGGFAHRIRDLLIAENVIQGAAAGTDFSGHGNNGIALSGNAAAADAALRCRISDNIVTGMGQIVDGEAGIRIGAEVEVITVADNTVSDCTGYGILYSNGDVAHAVTHGNTIVDINADGGGVQMGIRLQSANIDGVISENYIEGVNHGIRDDAGASTVEIVNNYFGPNVTDIIHSNPAGLLATAPQDGQGFARFLRASAGYNPPNIVSGSQTTTTVTVPGASLGDIAVASFGLDTQGIVISAQVTASNTVTVTLRNDTGGDLNLLADTLYVTVLSA